MRINYRSIAGSLLLSLAIQLPVQAVELEEIAALARAGAPQLALHLLDRAQGSPEARGADWLSWERERIYILQMAADWAAIRQHLQALPRPMPAEVQRWADDLLAQALLQLGDGLAAQVVLRQLIWSAQAAGDSERLRYWRRQLIEAYLVAADAEDAHTAMLRYQQDYGDAGADWHLLRARVLMQAGRYGDAAQLLRGESSPKAQAWALLARLRAHLQTGEEVVAQTQPLSGHADPQTARLLLAIAVEAAERPADKIRWLEQWLGSGDAMPAQGLMRISADDLWQAYRAEAERLGNLRQLLMGQEDAWFELAASLEVTDPLGARAVYALLATNAGSPGQREAAHERLATSLAQAANGMVVLKRLYLPGDAASDPASLANIPVAIRYRLVEQTLLDGEIALASNLMVGLDAPPPGGDGFNWMTRRARVFILSDRVEQGAALLTEWLAATPVMTDAQYDRLLQVVFDLQARNRHAQALPLFDRLLLLERPEQQRRELLFWKADSLKALGEKESAAWLYLRSATLNDALSMDAWAQTARYHAAEMLAEAGLNEDARRQFNSLLDVTAEAGRRAMLKHQLQKLQQ